MGILVDDSGALQGLGSREDYARKRLAGNRCGGMRCGGGSAPDVDENKGSDKDFCEKNGGKYVSKRLKGGVRQTGCDYPRPTAIRLLYENAKANPAVYAKMKAEFLKNPMLMKAVGLDKEMFAEVDAMLAVKPSVIATNLPPAPPALPALPDEKTNWLLWGGVAAAAAAYLVLRKK